MPKFSLQINGKSFEVEVEEQTPLLWVLRDSLEPKGTKYSCGIGLCGTCTVLVDNTQIRSCTTPINQVADKNITTIEGLSEDGSHPLQKAWKDERVTQCGYCQPGQLLNAAALLEANPKPTDADIDEAMENVLCRCGTYQRIRKAIHRAAEEV